MVDFAPRAVAALILAAASAVAAPASRPAAQPPPDFPNLDGFTAVPVDGYVTAPASGSAPGTAPRVAFAPSPTLVCDFYGGTAPAPSPSQDIKCNGDMPGLDDLPILGGAHPRPGDCVVGSVTYNGPGYVLSRMSYAGCDGNPAGLPSAGKPLGAGQKLSYLNVTCAVGVDSLVACLDTTSGDHGFVLRRSGSRAF
ncbi:hypothetical protein H7K15_15765 [Mycobacterium parmense]|nr:hypothetical protein [Mycobacterium parmense]MCV7351577.1 hypothetical protein [Mycobacterium parmense]